MRFDPALPDDSVNVSDRSAVREAVLLAAGVVTAAVLLVVALSLAVEVLVPLIPARFERYVSIPWADLMVQEDPRAAHMQAVVDRLVEHWPESELDYRVGVIDDEQPNALALPGGVIVVTTALLDRVENENEIAFILGHELGHFRNRDHLRGLGRGIAFTIALGLLGAGNGLAGHLSGLVGTLAARSFDRDQEYEADRFGLELVGREYGNANGAIEIFERLLVDRDDPSAPRTAHRFFDTHPSNPERIDNLRRAAVEMGLGFSGVPASWP